FHWRFVILPVALLMSATAAASTCKTTPHGCASGADSSSSGASSTSVGSTESSDLDRLASAGRNLGPATDQALVATVAACSVYRPRAGAMTMGTTGYRVPGSRRVPAPPPLRTTPRSAFRVTGLHGGSIPCGPTQSRNSLFGLPDEDDDTTS